MSQHPRVEPVVLPTIELRASGPLLPRLVGALETQGLVPSTTPQSSGPVILGHPGPPAPDLADDLVRDSRPHLFVGLARGHVDVGPFVDPGLTACLRCLCAAEVPVTLPGPPPRGAPPPSLLAVAAAFVAHDMGRWVGGHEPATWSATVRIDATLEVDRRSWLRHPQCGCTWSLPA